MNTSAILAPTLSRAFAPSDIAEVESFCAIHWGITPKAIRLDGASDEMFDIRCGDGSRYALKLTSPFEDLDAIRFQTDALLHVAAHDPSLPVPLVEPSLSARYWVPFHREDGVTPVARLMSWLKGVPQSRTMRTCEQATALGVALAKLGHALGSFRGPSPQSRVDWDLRHTGRLRDLIHIERDPDRQRILDKALDRFDKVTQPLLDTCRRQTVHNDCNPHNVLVDPDDNSIITGIVDFGDLVETALIADVAIAAAYFQTDDHDGLGLATKFVRSYHATRTLERDEIRLIPLLIEARHLMTVAITEWRAPRNPERRAYITRNTAQAWSGLMTFSIREPQTRIATFLDACGMD